MATDGRDELYWLKASVTMLEARVRGLEYELGQRERRIGDLEKENALLRRRLEEQAPPPPPAGPPPFVKPPAPPGRRKKPGRKAGHEAALRPPPEAIDRVVDVPLPRRRRARGRLCPHCRTPLRPGTLKKHRRLVEDLIPARVEVVCYRTASGYCPHCQRHVESRHPDQPPAADLPHAQLGPAALAEAAALRVEDRLPMRRVCAVPGRSGLRLCAGAVAAQVQRLGRWLGGE